jgi:hypothetical protein
VAKPQHGIGGGWGCGIEGSADVAAAHALAACATVPGSTPIPGHPIDGTAFVGGGSGPNACSHAAFTWASALSSGLVAHCPESSSRTWFSWQSAAQLSAPTASPRHSARTGAAVSSAVPASVIAANAAATATGKPLREKVKVTVRPSNLTLIFQSVQAKVSLVDPLPRNSSDYLHIPLQVRLRVCDANPPFAYPTVESVVNVTLLGVLLGVG